MENFFGLMGVSHLFPGTVCSELTDVSSTTLETARASSEQLEEALLGAQD